MNVQCQVKSSFIDKSIKSTQFLILFLSSLISLASLSSTVQAKSIQTSTTRLTPSPEKNPVKLPISILEQAQFPSAATEVDEQFVNINKPEQLQSTAESTELPTNPKQQKTLPNSEEETDQLFEQVFGNPRNRGVQQVIVPFFINDQQQDQVLVLLEPHGLPAVRWQAATFLEKLEEIVRPDIINNLQAAVDNQGNITLESLQEHGLDATFNERDLQLRIQVPPAQRRTNVYNLREGGLPPQAATAIRPSSISAYLNLRGGQEFIWEDANAQNLGRQPLRLNFDGSLNLNGWVIEAQGNFTEEAEPSFVRGDLRLVRDAPKQALRYVLGDISVPITGYQSSRPMAGITVARNFSLQPYLVTRPINQFEFFLESPSQVEVFINGALEQTIRLPAGPQDIRDLNLGAGLNDVELVITDDVGRVQRLNFATTVTSGLLAPGLQQFAYSLGFPSQLENSERSYDFELPTLTASHRWGVSNSLTMGAYLQADPQQQLVGFEGTWAASFGSLGWDLALSHDHDFDIGYAARLRYDYTRLGADNPSQRAFSLSLEHRGSNFMSLGEIEPNNDFALDLVASYRQKLFGDINSNLQFRYRLARGRETDPYRLSLRLSRSFGNGLGVNLNLTHTQNQTGSDEQRVSLNFFRSFPQLGQSLQTSSNISSDGETTNQLTWNYTDSRTVGGVRTSLGATQNANSYDFTGRLSRTGYRFNFDLNHFYILPRNGQQTTRNITRFNFGTALVFAGGRFGWSRPIDNSFVLVVPHPGVSDQLIGINPSRDNFLARIDQLGPAVLPSVAPYLVSQVQIEAPDLPIGYDLGQSVFNILPTYSSGTLIQVGTDAKVFLRGVLKFSNGEPVSLLSGQISSLSDPESKPLVLFTNRAGKFATEGLKPGHYQLRLFTENGEVLEFEIPEEAEGIYDIGTLVI
ncbi:MAG: fimbrial biogenesis outer membrane usher protein [Symploca sp. SIO2B6]|nr:fimbrial biogenesis outer membrane usher protein [Symploca sp. SIO2B6]